MFHWLLLFCVVVRRWFRGFGWGVLLAMAPSSPLTASKGMVLYLAFSLIRLKYRILFERKMALLKTSIWKIPCLIWQIRQLKTCLLLLSSLRTIQFSSVAQSFLTLRPHESQHARPPGASLTPRVYPNSCPLSQWCHPAISSSVIPFSSCPQSLPWSSHEVANVLEFQLQHQSFQWTPRTDLLQDGLVGSPCSPRDSQESSPTSQFKSINFSALSFPRSPTLTFIHNHWKNLTWLDLTRWTFVGKVMSLLFNMLSRLVITVLPRSKRLLISWLQSPCAVILEPKKK